MNGDAETVKARRLRDSVRPRVGFQESRNGAESDLARLPAAVLAAFLEQIDIAAGPAYDAIRRMPGYWDLDEADATRVLRSVRWVFVTLITCLQDERDFTGREVARLQEIGADLARWGIPLGAVQDAFSIGFESVESHLRVIASEVGGD